jgi:hypothetical protein
MRLEGWEGRLVQVIEAARHRPYVLGEHDCFRVACQAVEALTGEDKWPEFAGRYSTEREALHLLAQHGHSFEESFDWFFSVKHSDVRLARRGDIVALANGGQKHLGVCEGALVAALGPDGLVRVPLLECLCCWRIG